jgi:hypothetical protein
MPAMRRAKAATVTNAHGFWGISLSRSQRVRSRRTAGSVAPEAFRNTETGARKRAMAAIDPGLARRDAFDRAVRIAVRLVALVAYALCVAAVFLAARPLLPTGEADPVVLPQAAEATVYKTRPGDTLASIAATHGVGLGALLALNPDVTSVGLEPRTKIRLS